MHIFGCCQKLEGLKIAVVWNLGFQVNYNPPLSQKPMVEKENQPQKTKQHECQHGGGEKAWLK